MAEPEHLVLLVPVEFQVTPEPLGRQGLLVQLVLSAFLEAKVPRVHLETPAALDRRVHKEPQGPLVVQDKWEALE